MTCVNLDEAQVGRSIGSPLPSSWTHRQAESISSLRRRRERQVNGSKRRVLHRRPQAGVSMHLRRCSGSKQDRDTEVRGTRQNSIRQPVFGERKLHRPHRSALTSLIPATFCAFFSRLHLVLQIIILHTVADESFNGKPQASVRRTLRLRLAV